MLVVLAAVAAITISSVLVLYSLYGPYSEHTFHLQKKGNAMATNIEDTQVVVRAGDAEYYPNLVIDNNFLSPSISCNHCNRIAYTPGDRKMAGIAYFNDRIDLSSYQRVVFFARGQQGGEVLNFMSIGKNKANYSFNNLDIFPTIDFALITKNISLSKSWKKYEIDVTKADSNNILYPFGFVIYGNQADDEEIFYLKGVTFDRMAATQQFTLLNSSL